MIIWCKIRVGRRSRGNCCCRGCAGRWLKRCRCRWQMIGGTFQSRVPMTSFSSIATIIRDDRNISYYATLCNYINISLVKIQILLIIVRLKKKKKKERTNIYIPTLHWLLSVVLRWWGRGLVSKPRFSVVGGPLLPPLLDDELTEITLCGLLLQRPESSDIDTAIEFLNLGAI